jgi:hypothetical protein
MCGMSTAVTSTPLSIRLEMKATLRQPVELGDHRPRADGGRQ